MYVSIGQLVHEIWLKISDTKFFYFRDFVSFLALLFCQYVLYMILGQKIAPKADFDGNLMVLLLVSSKNRKTRVIHLKTRVGNRTRVLKKTGFPSITNQNVIIKMFDNLKAKVHTANEFGMR